MKSPNHHLHSFTKLSLFIIIGVGFFLFWNIDKVLAINNCNDGWQIAVGASRTINCHGVCKKITNSCSKVIFVPTRTSSEWAEFRSNKPNCVELSECCSVGEICNYGSWQCDGKCRRKRELYKYDSNCNCVASGQYKYQNCPSGTTCSGGSCRNDVACSTSGYTCKDQCTRGRRQYRCDGSNRCNQFWRWINTSSCNPFRCSGSSCSNICESSCGADAACDGKSPGSSCGSGKKCNSNCKCVSVCTGSLSCKSSTQNSITLNYSFSSCGTVYLYRGSTYVANLGSGSKSGSRTVSGLSSGTTYTFYLKEGSKVIASKSCSTQSATAELKLPNCPFSGSSGIWAGMKDVSWTDSGCYYCPTASSCGTCCDYCRSRLSGSYRFIYKKNWLGFRVNDLTTGSGPTFLASDGWGAKKLTKLCKIGNTPYGIPTCPFSGGESGRFYVTNNSAIVHAGLDITNRNNWVKILYPEGGSIQSYSLGEYSRDDCPDSSWDKCEYFVETWGNEPGAKCWVQWWDWPFLNGSPPSSCRICYVP